MESSHINKAAAELLTKIESQSKPANEIINAYTRNHKSFGSKDRQQLTQIVWQILRHKARLHFLLPNGTWIEKIKLFKRGLPDLSNAPQNVLWEIPHWLLTHIPAFETELPALLEIPPIILRANGNRDEIRQRLLSEDIETEPTPLSPYGLILKKRINLSATQTYKQGLIEVQDEGSQLAALQTNVHSGDTVLDYCAGAGGKSLIFAQMMHGKGRIIAHDVSQRSLNELLKRASRAHISCIDTTTNIPAYLRKNPNTLLTHVIVDAPCSGTGTWRRCPDARWKLTQKQFKELLIKQAAILKKAASFVPENGKLIYITCSLTQDENINQVRTFLKQHPNFKLCSHHQFSPARTGTDGLFTAIMKRNAENHQRT